MSFIPLFISLASYISRKLPSDFFTKNKGQYLIISLLSSNTFPLTSKSVHWYKNFVSNLFSCFFDFPILISSIFSVTPSSHYLIIHSFSIRTCKVYLIYKEKFDKIVFGRFYNLLRVLSYCSLVKFWNDECLSK